MLYSLWSAVIGVTKWGCPKGLKDGLRHTNISLSKSVNMLLMLVAMENQIMKCLLRSGTNQPMERINIYHWGSLCICQDLGEIQQCLSFSRNCIKRDGACISELWYFPTPHIPLPEFLTGSAVSIQPQKRYHWYRSHTSHLSINLSWTVNSGVQNRRFRHDSGMRFRMWFRGVKCEKTVNHWSNSWGASMILNHNIKISTQNKYIKFNL